MLKKEANILLMAVAYMLGVYIYQHLKMQQI